MAKKKAAKRKDAKDAAAAIEARTTAALKAKLAALAGKKLTRQQLRDLQWWQRAEQSRIIEAWTKAVPKGDYCRLASRQHKLIDDAAQHYDLPLRSATINLQEALTSLHDLIVEHAHILRKDLAGNRNDLEEEKLRHQIVGLERDNEKKLIELQFTRGDAIPRAAVREALVMLSAKLRTLGQTLERIDPEARDALNDCLESLAAEIEDGQLSF